MIIRLLFPTYFSGAYNIYTDFVPSQLFQHFHLFHLTLYNNSCPFLNLLSDDVILARSIQSLVNHHLFQTSPREK